MIIGVSGKINSGKDLTGKIIQYLTSTYNGSFNDYCIQFKILSDDTTNWQIEKFASKLKQIVSILTGCTIQDLESQEFKSKQLPDEWNHYIHYTIDKKFIKKYANEGIVEYLGKDRIRCHTYRDLLQLIGTDCMRNIIHENVWINALMTDYKSVLHWKNNTKIITDKEYQLYEIGKNGFEKFQEYKIYPNWIITDLRFENELQAIKAKGGISIRINRTIQLSDFVEGFEYQMKSRFGDGTVKSQKDYDNAEWIDCIYTKNLFPYIERMFTGKNNENNLLGLRFKQSNHPSEIALDSITNWDYIIDNNGTIEELIEKVKEILIKEKII